MKDTITRILTDERDEAREQRDKLAEALRKVLAAYNGDRPEWFANVMSDAQSVLHSCGLSDREGK